MLLRVSTVLLAVAAAFAQPAPSTSSAVKIDTVVFYGLNQVSPSLARQALGFGEGSTLPPSKGDAEDRLMDLDRIVSASLEVVFEDNKTILYVGVEERGAKHYDTRPAPGGALTLPDDILTLYRNYEQAEHAVQRSGKSTDALEREAQRQFVPAAAANFNLLRRVLRESGDEYNRVVAVSLLPYAPDKAAFVGDLHEALTDNDPEVRGKALQILTVFILEERKKPAFASGASPAWFLDMLHSVSFSDRTQAAAALELITRDRDEVTLARLRVAELPPVIEMARWNSEQYGYPAFLLVGRVAGLPDIETRDAWLRQGRDAVISAALQSAK